MALPEFGKIIVIGSTLVDLLFARVQVAKVLGHKNIKRPLKNVFKGKSLKKYKQYKNQKDFKLLAVNEPHPKTILLTANQVYYFFLKSKKLISDI